jgi:hypothetical protein
MVVDPAVMPVEGDPSVSQCWRGVWELGGPGGVNALATEGLVYLPVVYQANTYHLHMVSEGAP